MRNYKEEQSLMIKKMVSEIMQLALEITSNNDTDVFVRYAGHANLLCISIFNKGRNKDPLTYDRYSIYLDHKDAVEKVKEVLLYLRRLI